MTDGAGDNAGAAGTGTPVVLLHGLGANSQAFQRFMRLLPNEWDKHAFDLLGHGDAPKPDSGYALEDHADYMAGKVREQFPDAGRQGGVVVVGHSYGAAVGLAMAVLFPDIVRQLVLLDPGSRTGGDSERMMRARREGTLDDMVAQLFGDQSTALQRWVTDTWNTMALGVIDELDPDWSRFGAKVAKPVTVVHGDACAGASGEGAHEKINGADAVRIPGANHFLHATHAHETADAVAAAVTSRDHEAAR